MKLAIVTLLLSCAALAQAAQPKPLSEQDQALIANSKAVLEAQKTKDTNALKPLLALDFQRITSTGDLQKAEDFIDEAKESKLRSYMMYEPKVLAMSDTAEIVTFNAVIDMPEGDDYLAPRYQRLSDLWVKQGDQWKLKFEQISAIRHVD